MSLDDGLAPRAEWEAPPTRKGESESRQAHTINDGNGTAHTVLVGVWRAVSSVRVRVDGSRAAPRGDVLKSGTRAACLLIPPANRVGGGCCCEETGRSTSRSAFVQVVGLLNTSLPLTAVNTEVIVFVITGNVK